MQKLQISLKFLKKLCNKSFSIDSLGSLQKYPKQLNVSSSSVSKTHVQSFMNTSRTTSWQFQHYSILSNSAQKLLPGFSSTNPLVFMVMKRFFSSSNGAHLKQLNDLSCGGRVLSWRVKFQQRISRLLNDPWSALRWRSWFPSAGDDMVMGLVATNVAVYLLWKIADPTFMIKNFVMLVENFASRRVHTLITSAFSHTDEEHLINNMFVLYLFGTSIGRRFGPQFILQLYLAGAVGCTTFTLMRYIVMDQQSRGSGTYVDPNNIMALGTLLIGDDIRLMMQEGRDQICAVGHIGGAFVGALAWVGINRRWI